MRIELIYVRDIGLDLHRNQELRTILDPQMSVILMVRSHQQINTQHRTIYIHIGGRMTLSSFQLEEPLGSNAMAMTTTIL